MKYISKIFGLCPANKFFRVFYLLYVVMYVNTIIKGLYDGYKLNAAGEVLKLQSNFVVLILFMGLAPFVMRFAIFMYNMYQYSLVKNSNPQSSEKKSKKKKRG